MPDEEVKPQLDDWCDYITKELKGEEVLPSISVERTQSGDAILHAIVFACPTSLLCESHSLGDGY